jgi:PadR family transcriptional regulator, regulatory protein AphA
MERKRPAQVRLTGTSYAVLTLLHHLGEATPYDLKGALEKSVANFWPVPHTTFYAEPSRLVKGGYLTMRQERSGRRRKLYSLTDSGRAALHAWAHSSQIAESQLRDEGTLKIFAGADPVVVFAHQRRWRTRKLEELEGYLAAMEDAPEDEHTAAIRTTLRIGIGYERMLLDGIEAFLAQEVEAQAASDERAGSGNSRLIS